MDASTLLPPGPPDERAEAIHRSTRCFIRGVLGLSIPVLGLVPAVSALVSCAALSRRFRRQWNPAQHYLSAGGIFGMLGILSNTIQLASIIIAISDGLLQ